MLNRLVLYCNLLLIFLCFFMRVKVRLNFVCLLL